MNLDIAKIKEQIILKVNEIDDEMMLFNLIQEIDALNAGVSIENEDLTAEQKSRLKESIEQYKRGEIVPDIEVRKKLTK